MRPRQSFAEGTKELMERLLKEAKTVGEVKRIQCVLFRARENYDNATIAKLVGYTEESVKNIHSRFLRFGKESLIEKKKWGRYHAHITRDEENVILISCKKQGDNGEILEISTVKNAYEARIGNKVHETIVYRMLHAHGWRKVAPRPRHPKHDEEKAEAFKKNFHTSSKMRKWNLWSKEEVFE